MRLAEFDKKGLKAPTLTVERCEAEVAPNVEAIDIDNREITPKEVLLRNYNR